MFKMFNTHSVLRIKSKRNSNSKLFIFNENPFPLYIKFLLIF